MGSKYGAAFTEWLEARRPAIPPDKQLSKEAGVSLFIHFCFQFGASMSGVFLTLYLWRLTQSMIINGIYFAVNYVVVAIAFVLGGWLIKRKDRMVVYRIGIAMNAIFYLAVVFAGERVVTFYLLFAICNGIASAFYWVGYLTLMYDVSTDRNRIRYLAVNTITFTLGGLIGPALAGFLIRSADGLQGYTMVFGTACAMFLIASIGSLRIRTKPSHHKAYYLKYTSLLLRKHPRWTKSLLSFFTLGLQQGIMLFLPNILLYRIVGREDVVGYLGVLFAGLSIGAGFFISRFGTEERSRSFILYTSVGFVIGGLSLQAGITLPTVLIFMIIYSLCSPVQGNTVSSYFYRLIGDLPLRGELRVESVVLREIFMNAGRVVSIVSFVLISARFGFELLPWIVLAGALLQFLMVRLIERDKAAGAGESKNRSKSEVAG
ncbi:MFS transporter, YQGE family, putative transporter [Paenibacillus sp. UNCCL117]|uniref:MFS transporter n=1 Tax=unclassified Paenibacillus TaxID=185978 RepID=UPI000881EA90|nr:MULTISPECIES: MFS transporter [unclassified Paenibacillus]SDC03787.1 MFS transporter, YQGE family, putative transporter [Paenibacillus sp. cl123]SFW37162.1 MFS transporter, YQGE family, putative transporter [Paenibacillus sp. UNCCL117]